MRYLLIILFFAACQKVPERQPQQTIDTVYVSKQCDSLRIVADSLLGVVIGYTETLQSNNDSLKNELFVARYKIGRVRYYLNICLKNPSQDKFLKGWVRRAIE